jgi:hypothetical protein
MGKVSSEEAVLDTPSLAGASPPYTPLLHARLLSLPTLLLHPRLNFSRPLVNREAWSVSPDAL